jgi:hypothetical protein
MMILKVVQKAQIVKNADEPEQKKGLFGRRKK